MEEVQEGTNIVAISLDLSQSGDEFDISLFQSNGPDPLALQVKYWEGIPNICSVKIG